MTEPAPPTTSIWSTLAVALLTAAATTLGTKLAELAMERLAPKKETKR